MKRASIGTRSTTFLRGQGCALRWLFAATAFLILDPAAQATEGGLTNYPIGALSTAAGFMPPPGATEFYGYTLYDNVTSFRDDAGKPVPGLSAALFAMAPRIVHTWNKTFFGRFNLSSGVLFEPVYVKVKAGGARDEAAGIYLAGLEPWIITTTLGNWHLLAESIFYMPVGPYHPDKLANITTNYFATVQNVAATWTPNAKTEFSLDGAVEENLRNPATGYHSGDVFALTYGFGYRLFDRMPQWQLGFSGYYAYQFSNDTLHGKRVPTGYRLKKNAIGPKISYWFSPATAVIFQYHHEMGVRNGSKGDLYWIEFAFPL